MGRFERGLSRLVRTNPQTTRVSGSTEPIQMVSPPELDDPEFMERARAAIADGQTVTLPLYGINSDGVTEIGTMTLNELLDMDGLA